MMCRINPALHEQSVEKTFCRTMGFTAKPMMGYVLVDEFGMRTVADFEYWIGLCLVYNFEAKASKKRKNNLLTCVSQYFLPNSKNIARADFFDVGFLIATTKKFGYEVGVVAYVFKTGG